MIAISFVDSEALLKPALDMCYRILGENLREQGPYTYEAWAEWMKQEPRLLLYAHRGEEILAAVLARRESTASLICGFVACEERYRGKGISKRLMMALETEARARGFQYITLGSKADGFYESCGYRAIKIIEGQTIYQKMLKGAI